jgi:hypothetical protein
METHASPRHVPIARPSEKKALIEIDVLSSAKAEGICKDEQFSSLDGGLFGRPPASYSRVKSSDNPAQIFSFLG